MKKTAILINTCRGPVVDEKALYKAVRDEQIAGAGLDVMVEEPPTPDHELFSLKNIDLQPALGRPDLGQPPEALAQRLRQLRARRARPEAVLDRAGTAVETSRTTGVRRSGKLLYLRRVPVADCAGRIGGFGIGVKAAPDPVLSVAAASV